jgi:tetratricopeptide (TPR) repeat protein
LHNFNTYYLRLFSCTKNKYFVNKKNVAFAEKFFEKGINCPDTDTKCQIFNYTKSIELNPNVSDVYFNRALAFEEKGQIELAIADYTKAIELNPTDSDTYYNRAGLHVKQFNYGKAIGDYTKAIELNPDNPDAYCCRASVYKKIGDKEKEEADFRKYEELSNLPQ